MVRQIAHTLGGAVAVGVVILELLALLVIAGCASAAPMSAAERQAHAECDLEAARAPGYDLVAKIIAEERVRFACLRAKGWR